MAELASPDESKWQAVHRIAHPHLRSHMSRYTGYQEYGAMPVRRSELPCRGIPFIINFADGFVISEPDDHYAPTAPRSGFLAGFHPSRAFSQSTGNSACMEVKLSPLAVHGLLRIPMTEIAWRIVDLEDIFGADISLLGEALAEAQSWPERFALLDKFLLRRLADVHVPSQTAFILRKLHDAEGLANMKALAGEIGCSQKHLISLFRNAVGTTPKNYCRLLRFEKALQLVRDTSHPDWADIAQACGYYDQPHFIREFKAFSGETPNMFIQQANPGVLG